MALELAEARQAGHTARCEGGQNLRAPGWVPALGGREAAAGIQVGGRGVWTRWSWWRWSGLVLKVEQRGCGDDLSEGARTPRFLCSEELSER